MKRFPHLLAAASLICLCACTVAPLPTAPSAIATVQAASPIAADFELSFYRAFLQNGFESPERLEPIRLLRSPVRIYMRTQDDAGRNINTATLDATERTIQETARIWSGDTFDVVQMVRGTATKETTPGWITVKWSSAGINGTCGRSTVGIDGGFIELNASGTCSCGSGVLVYPRLVRHELGHAMGYYHTDNAEDVMYGQPTTPDKCDSTPSARERRHAIYAHQNTQ